MRAVEKISLLIVEDDAAIRYLMEEAASRTGDFGPIAVAEDGRAALDWLQQRSPAELPDLIVTDLSMPRLTGIELVQALKADSNLRAIPAAVITSSDIPNDREDALAAGACVFLKKPHGLEALTQIFLGLRDSCRATSIAARSAG